MVLNTVSDLFRFVSTLLPESVAIEDDEVKLTYRDLDFASSNFCCVLREHGVQEGWLVPVLSTRSATAIVAILGVLKAGAAYIPLDADYSPIERVKDIISQADATVFVDATTGSQRRFEPDEICMDIIHLQKPDLSSRSEIMTMGNPDNLAYVIFTSGTMSHPKGVMVQHRCLVNYIAQRDPETPFNLGMKPGQRALCIFSPAFDAFTGVLFSTICNGGTCVLSSPEKLIQMAPTCDILPLTPSILSTLHPTLFDSRRQHSFFLGGEAIDPNLLSTWWNINWKFYNAYGPTEATCACLITEVQPGNPIHLGKPMVNCPIYLLNEDLKEAPFGEIYIGGEGLALGYLKNPELTAAKFTTWCGNRVYATGDLAKRMDNGKIQFVGRKGNLVKNRGFLVNLEEDVTRPLAAQPEIDRAISTMCDSRLVAFVLPQTVDSLMLKERLSKTLPLYHVPDEIVPVVSFPQTRNNKVDLQALVKDMHLNRKEFYAPTAIREEDDISLGNNGVLASRERILLEAIQKTLGKPCSVDDSFLLLGGHSLAAVSVAVLCQQNGLLVSTTDIISKQTVRNLLDSVVRLEDENNTSCMDPTVNPEVSKIPVEIKTTYSDGVAVSPLTDTQRGMLRGCLEEPSIYNLQVSMDFNCQISPSKLRQAFQRVFQAHSIFRASFHPDIDDGVLILHANCEIDWEHSTYNTWDSWAGAVNQEKEIFSELYAVTENRGLCRLRLFKLEGTTATLIWSVFHGFIDGYSMRIIFNDVANAYASDMGSLGTSCFLNFSWYLQRRSRQAEHSRRLQWWSQEFEDVGDIPLIELPRPLSFSGSHRPVARTEYLFKSKINSTDLVSAAAASAVTAGTVLLSAWALLLCEYMGTNRPVFGMAFSGRDLPIPNSTSIVGPMVNVLPFVISVDEDLTKTTFLQMVSTNVQNIALHQTSLADVKSVIHRETEEIIHSVFAVQFEAGMSEMYETKQYTALGASNIQVRESTGYSLNVMVEELKTGPDSSKIIGFRLLYDDRLYTKPSITRIAQHLENLVTTLMEANLDDTLQYCLRRMNSSSQIDTLLQNSRSDHHSVHTPGEESCTIPTFFQRMVTQFPETIAIQSEQSRMTYSELDEKSDFVARVLFQRGVKCGDNVAIIADGSVQWVIGIFGILKTGGVYVPIDPSLPPDHQQRIYSLGACTTLLSPLSSSSLLGEQITVEEAVINISRIINEKPTLSTFPSYINSETPTSAVLIFTSGTTGTPKGIFQEHRGIISFLQSPQLRKFCGPGIRLAQFMATGFDGTVFEVFGALCFGGTLVLRCPHDPFLALKTADAALMTPSSLAVIEPLDYPSLQVIASGGEPLSPAVAHKWLSANRELFNFYGPAEATVLCTIKSVEDPQRINVGRPIPNARIYILNPKDQKRLMPVGVPGELFIAGIQVTKGYLGDERNTASAFYKNDPLNSGFRMYRTGDRARWTEDGELEVMGRIDPQAQIKVRGFRVDLQQLQYAVIKCRDGITSVTAIVHQGNLVCFVTPAHIDLSGLRKQLRKLVPRSAIPTRFIALDHLPLTRNQKLDTRALLALASSSTSTGRPKYHEKKSSTQKTVIQIWREILGDTLDPAVAIGPSDSFIDLGGHSLYQVRLAAELSKSFQVDMPLRTVIECDSVTEIASSVDQLRAQTAPKTPSITRNSRLPSTLSHLEEEMLQIYTTASQEEASSYTVVAIFRIHSPIDVKLCEAFNAVLARHEIFQSRYIHGPTKPTREFFPEPPSSEIVSGPIPDISLEINRRLEQPFHLSADSAVRVCLLEETRQTHVAVVSMAHIIADLVTLRLFLKETATIYRGELLPKLGPTYIDWTSERVVTPPDAKLHFWERYLDGYHGTNWLPRTGVGHFQTFTLRSQQALALRDMADHYCVTPQQLFTALIALVLMRVTRIKDLVLTVPFLDRTVAGAADMMGLFLDRLPIRVRPTGCEITLSTFFQHVRESSQAALANFISFDALVSHLRTKLAMREGVVNPLLNVMVSHRVHNVEDILDLGGILVEELPTPWLGGSKFPLMIEIVEDVSRSPNVTTIRWEYDLGVWEPVAIQELQRFLDGLIESIAECSKLAFSLQDILPETSLQCGKTHQGYVGAYLGC